MEHWTLTVWKVEGKTGLLMAGPQACVDRLNTELGMKTDLNEVTELDIAKLVSIVEGHNAAFESGPRRSVSFIVNREVNPEAAT